MNENPPPSESEPPKSTRPPTEYWAPPEPPNFWAMFGLGVLLVIVSCIICAPFQSPVPFGFGFLVAFCSLFFPGYRGIFIGFISTIGVVLLGTAVICGAMLSGMR